MPNVIGIRRVTEFGRAATETAIKSYCDRLALPTKGLEWQETLSAALDRGVIVVAHRFADLFPKPSEVDSSLSEALARGKQVHCTDLGDLTSQLATLRIICAAFEPLEEQIASLQEQLAVQEETRERIQNDIALIATRKVMEQQLGLTIEEAKREAREGVRSTPAPEPDMAPIIAAALAERERLRRIA